MSKYNNLKTTVGTGGIASGTGATTLPLASKLTSSAGDVPTLAAGDSFKLTIISTAGTEIVLVTAYVTGATSAMVARAQEGTSAIAHAAGDTIVHAPTVADFSSAVGAARGCRAYRSSAYSIPNAVGTDIPFDAESFDTDGFHDNTTNPARITIPAGMSGYYLIESSIRMTGAGSLLGIDLMVNGSAVVGGSQIVSPGYGTSASATVYLNAGDYVTVNAYQNSGSAKALDISSGWNHLSVTSVSSAVGAVAKVPSSSVKRTAGNLTLATSASYANVDTGLDVAIAAAAGDVIEYDLTLSAYGSATDYLVLDAVTLVSGAPVNSLTLDGTPSTSGSYPGWASGQITTNASARQLFQGTKRYVVQAGDIANGVVTIRLRYRSGTGITIAASGDPYIYCAVRNLSLTGAVIPGAGHAEYTLTPSAGNNDGSVTLGTFVVDSTFTTDATMVTPGAGGVFTVAQAGTYDITVTAAYSAVTPSGRHFVSITRGASPALVARATLVVGVGEDTWAVAAAGVRVLDQFAVVLYRGTINTAAAPALRVMVTRRAG